MKNRTCEVIPGDPLIAPQTYEQVDKVNVTFVGVLQITHIPVDGTDESVVGFAPGFWKSYRWNH